MMNKVFREYTQRPSIWKRRYLHKRKWEVEDIPGMGENV